jgi:hypothetical protein
LFRSGFADAMQDTVSGMGGMLMDRCEQIERGAWAGGVALCLQAHAHDEGNARGRESRSRHVPGCDPADGHCPFILPMSAKSGKFIIVGIPISA